jgi:hypothetical protein
MVLNWFGNEISIIFSAFSMLKRHCINQNSKIDITVVVTWKLLEMVW